MYPSSEEQDNLAHQAKLRAELDKGKALVHFAGHGGRYIWRTGPPDLSKNHDLFTLDDLERLKPNERLPIVLSMTCYSAPFDHPSADSIGEKFLRLEERGAVAVVAASWRNQPSEVFSETLLELLSASGDPTRESGLTVGEALMGAKAKAPSRLLVETYNLLGDPATRACDFGVQERGAMGDRKRTRQLRVRRVPCDRQGRPIQTHLRETH